MPVLTDDQTDGVWLFIPKNLCAIKHQKLQT